MLLVILPTWTMIIIWGDATMSDFEFEVRGVFYLLLALVFMTGLCVNKGTCFQRWLFRTHASLHRHIHTHINQSLAVLVTDMGRLIKDVESVVVAFDTTDGVYITTVEDVALANITNDIPFMVTRHVYLRSTGTTRLLFTTIYLIYFFVKSMTAPEEVSASLALRQSLTLLLTGDFECLSITCTHARSHTPPPTLPPVPNPEGCAGSHRWSTGGGAARQCRTGGNTVRLERWGPVPGRRASPGRPGT